MDQKLEPTCLDEPDPVICPDAGQLLVVCFFTGGFFVLPSVLPELFGPLILYIDRSELPYVTRIGCFWTTL